jgi:hypothetical protein
MDGGNICCLVNNSSNTFAGFAGDSTPKEVFQSFKKKTKNF